jgi:membrane protein DedA with SNARE-associated domain
MMAFTTTAYFLGRAIGEPGLVWLDQHSKTFSRFVRWLQRFFQRWSYFAIFVFPLGAMASIAGAAGIPPIPFFVCAIAGVAFRLSLLVLLAESIREPLMKFIELVQVYQLPATAVCIAGVVGYQVWKRYKGPAPEPPVAR